MMRPPWPLVVLLVTADAAADEEQAAPVAATSDEVAADPAAEPAAKPTRPPIDWAHVVRYDPGRDDERRLFVTAEGCALTPCVLTRDGAVRIDVGVDRRLELAFWLVHRGQVTRIDYIEKRAKRDYLLLERMFDRRPNRSLWSLTDRLESGEIDTFYVYGVTRQYEIAQGDPLVLEVSDRDDPRQQRTYYFRYHEAGFKLSLDVALLVPINALNLPKPDPPWASRQLNAAMTLALRRNRDPELSYAWIEKVIFAGHPTIFAGILNRRLERPGTVPKDRTDLFIGAGITYFDFIFLGWGANLIYRPHTSSPFVGVHVGKAIQFIRDLNRTSPEAWDEYLEAERRKEILVE